MTKEIVPTGFDAEKNIIHAPKDPAEWPGFRRLLAEWRSQTRKLLNYDDELYRKAEFHWAASSYACYFIMMCDETFYDAKAGCYKVDALLDEGQREFGGYDSVVLWHAYPRIGVDELDCLRFRARRTISIDRDFLGKRCRSFES
jgi:hypothetical protein